jgi:hypothetical protein
MAYRDSGVAVNSSNVSSIQFQLGPDIAAGDEIAFGVIWINTGHTGFTPVSDNGGGFTSLTGLLTDAASRSQFWRRTAISGDANSTITISTTGATTGRVIVVWSARSGVGTPVAVLSEPASGGDMPWPAATPGGGSTSGDVVYVGVARTTGGGQSVHSAGSSGATFRETVTNNAGSGNNGNGCVFDSIYTSGAQVPTVTTDAVPDTSGGRKLVTLLYPATGAILAGNLGLAAALTGARDSAGAIAAALNLQAALTGARASQGALAGALNLQAALTGTRASQGALSAGLGLSVTLSGERGSLGQLQAGLGLASSLTGARASLGVLAGSLHLAVSLTGTNEEEGRAVRPFPYPPRAGAGFPWTPRPVKSFEEEVGQP